MKNGHIKNNKNFSKQKNLKNIRTIFPRGFNYLKSEFLLKDTVLNRVVIIGFIEHCCRKNYSEQKQ